MKLNQSFILSINTTGPNIHRDRITEICVVLPEVPKTLHLHIYSVQNAKEPFTHRNKQSVSQAEALEKFCDFISGRNVLVGHDIEGDVAFLANTFDRIGVPYPDFKYLDVADLASSYLFDIRNVSIDFLSNYYNLENPNPSTIREIAENIAKIFSKIYGDLQYNPFDKEYAEKLNHFQTFNIALEQATEKQKNYLERLLVNKNIHMDLSDITKYEASRQIERLLEEKEER